MSIYDKQISDLTPDDLQELLAETPVENIRLEFKREDVSKDEYLKKLVERRAVVLCKIKAELVHCGGAGRS